MKLPLSLSLSAVFAALALCRAAAAELDLAGVWRLTDGEHDLPAFVPGGVHDALLENGVIDDIYYGANETKCLWVARRGWTFSRTFTLDAAFLASREIVLRLEDCDAFAKIYINGRVAGETTDRFQRYTFYAKPYLREGGNTIEAVFESPVAEADRRREALGRPYPIANVKWAVNQALVRKPACHGGWDWGPEVESIGLCGTVKLIAADKPRIDYVYASQKFNADLSHCTLTTYADLSDGTTVTNKTEIDNPPLWWPNGAGERKFYTYTIDVNGEKITRRIGLRKLEVLNEKDETGLSLVFRVNNRRIFAKGANWIPCDALERRQTPEKYRGLLESAAAANMNMIRVWGGGQYEKDCFYDICDELGLLVWHDMMCACATYPADENFLGEIRAELSHQLRRLRDHASIALWCGDNECLGAVKWFKETEKDVEFYREAWVARSKMQGEAVAKFDPDRTYWPSSPCCGPGDFGDAWKDDSRGDMHQWDVWHENQPFERYLDYRPRFCSEFGFQSFSSPAVAATFCKGPGDDFEWHQKNAGGNERIRATMRRMFGDAKDFESELLLSQFQQALAIKTAVDAWRAEMPRCMGTLYWQLNDNWPVASWSSIEYGGKWKPLHYAAKRFFAPVSVIARPNGDIVGINDGATPVDGVLTIERWLYDGAAPVSAKTLEARLAPGAAAKIGSFDPSGDGFVVLRFGDAANDWHGAQFRDVPLADAKISATVENGKVVLETDKPAFYVWVEAVGVEGEFSDNCISLLPSRPVELEFIPRDAGAKLESVKVVSLAGLTARRSLPRVKDASDGRPKARWRGFNLLDLVSWREGAGRPRYREDDFRAIHGWGFNFVRLPLDYRWFEGGANLEALDEAIEWGRKYSLHVQLCLHRLPGYCSGGPLPGEASLFEDKATLEKACGLWRALARRYRDVPNERLSFNLFNEPLYMEEAVYARVARALSRAIREESPERFLLADGLGYGRIAPMSLGDIPGLGFGWHCYDPFFVTHHKTPWNDPGSVAETPRWPVDTRTPRDWLVEETFDSKRWRDAVEKGVFIYAGEFGSWRATDHATTLALMEDQLKLWKEIGCGWALWGLGGDFGILDSNRADVEYADFHGRRLDRKMLELLQRY